MAFATAPDGCRLYYESTGRGEETVLLIPGLGGDGRFWGGVVPLLAPRFRVIVADHRGAGRSARPEGPYSVEGIAADMRAVLAAAGAGRVHGVGHSTGGAVVQVLALDDPDTVGRLVISGSWARADARFRMLFGARLRLIEAGEAGAYQQLTHVLGYDAATLEREEAALEQAVREAPRLLAPLSVTAARLRMLLAFDRAAELCRIAAPTLVLGSREDALVPFAHSEALAAAIPGAGLEAMEGGHFYPRTHPESFARRILAHLVPGVA